jgi:hypothetical protein
MTAQKKKTSVLCQFFGEAFQIIGSDGSLILKISKTKSNTVILKKSNTRVMLV